jgi:hypothetical protein
MERVDDSWRNTIMGSTRVVKNGSSRFYMKDPISCRSTRGLSHCLSNEEKGLAIQTRDPNKTASATLA